MRDTMSGRRIAGPDPTERFQMIVGFVEDSLEQVCRDTVFGYRRAPVLASRRNANAGFHIYEKLRPARIHFHVHVDVYSIELSNITENQSYTCDTLSSFEEQLQASVRGLESRLLYSTQLFKNLSP